MSREKEGYRDNLVRLDEHFPNKELLETKELADFLGVCARTVKKHFPIKNGYISKAEAARTMST